MTEIPSPSVVDGLIQCLHASIGASGSRLPPSAASGGDVNRLLAYIRQFPEHNLGRKLLRDVETNLETSSNSRSNETPTEFALWIGNNIFDILTVLLQIESIKLDVIESSVLWIIRGHIFGRTVSYCVNLLSNVILMLSTTPLSEMDVERAFRLLRNCVDMIFAAASDSDSSLSSSSSFSPEALPTSLFDLIAPCASASQALSRRHRGLAVDNVDGAYAVSMLLQQSWTRRFPLYSHLLCDLSAYLTKNHVMQFQRKIVESLGGLPSDDVASVLGACIRLFELSLDPCWIDAVRIIYSNISPASLQSVEVLLESSLSIAHQRNDSLLISCSTCMEDAVCNWARSFIQETYSEKNVYDTHSDLDGILFVTLSDVSLLLLIARVVLDLRGSFSSTEHQDSDSHSSSTNVRADQLTRTIMMTLLSYCFVQARAARLIDFSSSDSIVSSLKLEDATSLCLVGHRLLSAEDSDAPRALAPSQRPGASSSSSSSSSHQATISSSSSDNPRNRQSWLACSRAAGLVRLCEHAARHPVLLDSCFQFLLDSLKELYCKTSQGNEDLSHVGDVYIPQSVGVAFIADIIVSVFRIVEPSRLTILQSAMRSLIDSSASTWNNQSNINRQGVMLRVMTVLCRSYASMLRPLQSHLQTLVPMLFLLPQKELEIAIEPMLLAVCNENVTQDNAELHNAIIMLCKKAAGQKDPERCIFGIQSLIRLFPSMPSEAQLNILKGLLVPIMLRENTQEFRAAIQTTICTGFSKLLSENHQRTLSNEVLLSMRGLLLSIFLGTCVLVDIDGSLSPLPDYAAEILEKDASKEWMAACKANGKPYFCTSKCYTRITKSRAQDDYLTSLTLDVNSLVVAFIAVENSLDSSFTAEAINCLCRNILCSSEADTESFSSWLEFVLCSCTNWLREGFCIAATNEALRTDVNTNAAVATAFGLLRGIQQIVLSRCFHGEHGDLQERDYFEALTVLQSLHGLLREASASSGQPLHEVWRNAVFPRKYTASGLQYKSLVDRYPVSVEGCSTLLSFQASRALAIVDAVSRGVYDGVLDPFLDLLGIVDALRESVCIFQSVASAACSQSNSFTMMNTIFSIFQSLGCAQVEDSLLSAASSHLFHESQSLEPPLCNISHLNRNRGGPCISASRGKKTKGRRSIYSDFSDDSSDDEDPIRNEEAPKENASKGPNDSNANNRGWSVYATSCYSLIGADALCSNTSDSDPRWTCSAWALQWSSLRQNMVMLGVYRSPTSSKHAKLDKLRWKTMRSSIFALRLDLLSVFKDLSKISYDLHNEVVLHQILSNSRTGPNLEPRTKLCKMCSFIADDLLRSSAEGLTQALLENYLDVLSILLKILAQSRVGEIRSEQEIGRVAYDVTGLEFSDKIIRILCCFDHLTAKTAVKLFSLSIMAAGSSISIQCTQACKMLWLSTGFGLRGRTVRASKGMDVLACLPSPTSLRSKADGDFPSLALKFKDKPSIEALQIGSLRCINTIFRSGRHNTDGTIREAFLEKEANLLLFFNVHIFVASPEEVVNDWILKTLSQPFELYDSKVEKSEVSVFQRLPHRSRACMIDALSAFLSSITSDMWTMRRFFAQITHRDEDDAEGNMLGKRPRKSVRKLSGGKNMLRDNVLFDIPFLVILLQDISYFTQILPRLNDIDVSTIRRHLIEMEVNLSVLISSSPSLQRKQNKAPKDGHIARTLTLLQCNGASLLSALSKSLGTSDAGPESSMQDEVDANRTENDDDDASSTELRVKRPKRRRRQRRLHSRNAVVNAWLAEEDGAEEDMYADLEDFLVA